MWGIIPAAGRGSRIQPLAFSKELLPVGSRMEGATERPRAVSEYLLERMLRAGADKLCFVISSGKSDIVEYYGGSFADASVCYVVQPAPTGLCDSVFRPLPFIAPNEPVLLGLPDTVWFPHDGLAQLADGELSLLLFPVERPELFDAVVTEDDGRVRQVLVKQGPALTPWVWGAIKLMGHHLHALHALWCEREQRDEFLGTLLNAYIDQGGVVRGVRAGASYVDVGTLHGYRQALRLLESSEGVGLARRAL
jgi:glucose-1-phosphate thymidylyltransferase